MDKALNSFNTFKTIEEVDLNDLFSLTYSFDKLRGVLTGILTNQEETKKIFEKFEERLQSLENGTITPIEKNGLSSLEIPTSSISGEKQKDLRLNIKKIKPSESLNTAGITNTLKINQIERTLNNLIEKTNRSEIAIEELKNNLKNLLNKSNEYGNNFISMKKDLDDIKVKATEFNVYDILKDVKSDNGTIDSAKFLVKTLESKMFKKFGMIDTSIQKLEEASLKSSNDITNLVTTDETTLQLVGKNKDFLTEEIEKLKDSNEALSKALSDNAAKMNSMISNLKKDITKTVKAESMKRGSQMSYLSFKEGESGLQSSTPRERGSIQENKDNQRLSLLSSEAINAPLNDKPGGTEIGISEKEFKKFKEAVTKRLYEHDKKIHNFNCDKELQNLKEEFGAFKIELLPTLVKNEAFNKEKAKIKSLLDKMDYFSDFEDNISEELKSFKKEKELVYHKIEVLSGYVATLQNSKQNSKGPQKANLDFLKMAYSDLSKYLTIETFKEYVNVNRGEIEKIKKEYENIYRMINLIKESIVAKPDDSDLKSLEEYLFSMISEIKNALAKKYLEKFEYNKQVKVFENKFLNLYELLSKPEPRGNNWLIAKKPLGGYSCASCETYLGELSNTTDFVTWNKMRSESTEKATTNTTTINMRTGNGFSRILNLLNLQGRKESSEQLIESQRTAHGSLPKLMKKSETENNIMNKKKASEVGTGAGINSTETICIAEKTDIKEQLEEHELNGGPRSEPKVMKVYRLTKKPMKK